MDRWRGQIALVTGASAGIGASIAQALASKGLKVVACARRLDKLQEIAREGVFIIKDLFTTVMIKIFQSTRVVMEGKYFLINAI